MSKKSKIPVYFMPGMAANHLIFDGIKLPEDTFEVYFLEWLIPEFKESLEHYAERLTENIRHENPVLIGVSFGGIVVQEMAKFIKLRKLIIISSVKHESELPRRIKFARVTRVYKLIPTKLVKNIELLAKFAIGETVVNRMDLYQKYLSVRDPRYLSWAIHQIINWKQTQSNLELIHIQGDKDKVFPVINIQNFIAVKGGTHIMIVNRFKWFNEFLPLLITEES
ncbi:Pimeloyl-ACP methyl ester carboxylesterase [Pustulibacterium marinum]|uniref:Pimeloyl-ACP methyl ester carboxylesterase n=1 Tax=Pustulibacterium marinum TaxID=1224947 RepID=A0A1I7G4Z7_9FLAO|nr:alpha/beta hydrolase [Pustulibacterium marinum]SFU43493.1 Pimeloyl-ACP methyl ester carboxylesterase [Pustulibacterium marinum]